MTEMTSAIQRINFTIKYPDFKGRGTFALLKVTHYKDGTKKAETITNDRFKALNHDWQNSKQTETKRDELLRLAKEIRGEVHRSQQIKDGKIRLVKHIDNLKILADFVAERIEDRKVVNPKGHEQDFTRAVLVIDRENLSLKTATRKELQKAVNKIDRNNIHRRVCSRLNSLLSCCHNLFSPRCPISFSYGSLEQTQFFRRYQSKWAFFWRISKAEASANACLYVKSPAQVFLFFCRAHLFWGP